MLAAEVRALQPRLTGEAEAEAQALVAALFAARGLSEQTGEGATLARARELTRAAGLQRELAALTGLLAGELARIAGRLDAVEVTGARRPQRRSSSRCWRASIRGSDGGAGCSTRRGRW
ncbi:hypothetical protein [Nannocystis pusilla]|uniref:hypothetical protein n=1 Tax=Nannocystis pusilla TaxID=889268 RepID=UPI003B7B31A8